MSDSVARAETVAAKSDADGTAASATPPRASARSIVPVGTVVGRYELGERIGAGGMGTVYRARDPKLDRDIAVKLVSTTDVEQYLEREAQAMAKLSHPNVCTVHDIGTWNGQLFIAMELCSGGSLASWLAEPRPWREVLTRFVAAGRGLAAAHRINLVHRDFKPDNVLVQDGVVKVSDFGLVRSSAVPTGDSNPDRIEGTPAYMAPEQLEGFEVDARADQFAFAVSVWEGVCGGRPFQFEGKDYVAGMLRAIRGRRLMRSTTAKVPSRVLGLLERALAADPNDRWPSLEALVDALDRAARPTRKRFIALAAGAAIAAAGATALVMRVRRPEPDVIATTRIIERNSGELYRALGELVIARDRKALSLPREQYEVALAANTAALAALGDRELRPRVARSLIVLQRCEDAVIQLDAYLNEGGTAATVTDIDGYEIREEGGSTPIDRAWVASLKLRCDEQNPNTVELRYERAMRLWRDGNFEAAVIQLEQLVSSTGNAQYIKTIGDIWQSAGNCDEARKQYRRWIDEDKTIPPEWVENAKHAADHCKSN